MRWRQSRRSDNVEDLRGQPTGRKAGKAGLAGGGIGTILIVIVAMYFGVDPSKILGLAGGGGGTQQVASPGSGINDEMSDFIRAVLGETEDVWNPLFKQMGRTYEEPKLVIFSGQVQAGRCGLTSAAVGPFYCPANNQVYIDLSFYNDLKSRFKAPGDFAQAYVIAHEVGHHVQNILGISNKVHAQRQRVSQTEGNQLSVRQELQADCFAGVWARHAHEARNILEKGDVEEALTAAAAIGDDRLQKQSQGHVVPESFTHGSSAQRVKWFRIGIEFGDVSKCDTFSASNV